MKIHLYKLELSFIRSKEIIDFRKITYFYGKMGAGKSSIARLLDYCLGGQFELSTALASEFSSAKLYLSVNNIDISIERYRESDSIQAIWNKDNETMNVILPARKSGEVVIPNTEVEVLSDLFFYLCGIRPPKVRKSRVRDESDLSRLSLRDLLWYCYLDQDSMDSDFFNLDGEAVFFKRLKSREVLRFIVGFHQERISELEVNLQEVREQRLQMSSAALSLKEALNAAEVGSEEDIVEKIKTLQTELGQLEDSIALHQFQLKEKTSVHGIDMLRDRARSFSYEIESLQNAIPDVEKLINNDQRHVNELLMLTVKFRRVASARAVLSGVAFEKCPRCAQNLPARLSNECQVCGQEEPIEGDNNLASDVLSKDTKNRIDELKDMIKRHRTQLTLMKKSLETLMLEKKETEIAINHLMQDYDSAYLTSILVLERKKASIEQRISDFIKIVELPRKVEELIRESNNLQSQENEIRQQLRDARKDAEHDTKNLSRLEELFLDCLLRARMPGISSNDNVVIESPDFLPQVISPGAGDLAITSFSNLSSGGKKTLFKVCFSLAIHRLAVEISALLPTFIIIDSPMKNISERENREQFEGLHRLIYDLVQDELINTQIIIIDKEYYAPNNDENLDILVRHMTPSDDEYPPLIPYYRGH